MAVMPAVRDRPTQSDTDRHRQLHQAREAAVAAGSDLRASGGSRSIRSESADGGSVDDVAVGDRGGDGCAILQRRCAAVGRSDQSRQMVAVVVMMADSARQTDSDGHRRLHLTREAAAAAADS